MTETIPPDAGQQNTPIKIGVITTVWYPFSHADVIVSRWIKPFATDEHCGWKPASSVIASVFLDQTPANDIGGKICASNGIPLFDSVEGALTLGGDSLAVDAVLLIGEHGNYPINEFGQKLYPRKRLFDAITAVFRKTGQTAPVFNDKHLSWDFALSREMVETADELGFPLSAGTSLTHCPLDPCPPLAAGEGAAEALSLFYGDPENYGFHSMEFAQSLVERRPGGETGIRAVRSFEGALVQRAIEANDIPRDLLRRALSRHGYPNVAEIIPFIFERVENPLAYQIQYLDGLRVTHLCLPLIVTQWVAAIRAANGEIRSCRVSLAGASEFFNSFARLNAQVEKFFLTREPVAPLLRTHLVAGGLQMALQARKQVGQWVETPHLAISYSKSAKEPVASTG